MTSQKSTNKENPICLLALMREDLRHKHWLLALSILGSFFAGPVAILFYFTAIVGSHFKYYVVTDNGVFNQYHDFIMTVAEYNRARLDSCIAYFNTVHLVTMVIIAFFGALIVAFTAFRFLYHKQMVDLYHSAPVSRRRLFTAIWLNGFLIWLAPALVSSFIVFLIAVIYMKGMFFGTLLAYTLLVLLRLSLVYLIVYHVCLVGVMLCGNVINAIICAGTIGCGAFAIVAGILVMLNTFNECFYLPDKYLFTNPLYAFSPLVTPVLLVLEWLRAYSVSAFALWHLLAGAVIMVCNLLLAFYLYAKRPSELSERGLDSKPVRIGLRAVLSALGGVAFCMLFYAVADGQLGWMLFGVLLGSALVFCFLNVICHGSFKEVVSHKLQYVIVLIVSAAVVFGIKFDVLGYAKRLPSVDQITGLSLYSAAFSESDSNCVAINGIIMRDLGSNYPKDVIVSTDAEKIHALLAACIEEPKEYWYYGYSIVVKVHTKLGSYYRRYYVYQEDVALLAPFVESEEYAKAYYPVLSLEFGAPKRALLSGSFTYSEDIVDEGQLAELTEALHADFMEHRNVTDMQRDSRKFSLNLYYAAKDGSTHSFSYNIPYWYEHTTSLIDKWYPDKVWDPTLEDLQYFTVSYNLSIQDVNQVHDTIYAYFGYDPQGNPLKEIPSNSYVNEPNPAGYATWNFRLTSPELLKAVESELIWGYYHDPATLEYVDLGMGHMKQGGNVECYVKSGTLPLEVVNQILENLELEIWNDEGEVYYYSSHYPEYDPTVPAYEYN